MSDESERYRYAGFPMDGRLRWLRWLDHVDLRGSAGSPTIEAHLVVLPDDLDASSSPQLADVLVFEDATVSRHHVVVGSLPALRPGMIFRDGEQVGDLQMETFGSSPLGPSKENADLISANAPVPSPRWAAQWTLLPATGYPLGRAKTSFCLRLLHGGWEVLIPASEVFRVFCAPETLLANAILSGEWENVVGKVLNEAFCEQTDEEWRVGLRTGLTEKSAAVLAAYRWTEAGKAARNQLRSGLLQNDPRLQAKIPYGFDGIELSGEGLKLTTRDEIKRFLLLRITSVKITGLHEITLPVRFRLDNYNVKHSTEHEKDERPPLKQPVLVIEDSGSSPSTISNVDPPSSVSIVRRLPWVAPAMKGFPEVSPLPLDPRIPTESERRRRLMVPELTDVGSTAIPQRGHRPVVSITHAPEVRKSLGFAAVATVLQVLMKSGTITTWLPEIPENLPWQAVADVQAWKLPAEIGTKRAAFSFLHKKTRRTCLVARIEIGEKKVYWLEIERRASTEGFRYLLLKADPNVLGDVICGLLRSATQERGVWGRTVACNGNYTSRAFKHFYDKEGAIDAGSASRSIRLMVD